MTLKEALKHIVEIYGAEELLSPRLFNLISDFNAFDEHPSIRPIFRTFINEGFAKNIILNIPNKVETNTLLHVLYDKYGLRRDISALVLDAFLSSLGIMKYESNNLPSSILSENIQPSEHIIFSGISLGKSISEIATHLTTRGFLVKQSKPYQIKMFGTFCNIDDVTLIINGSPFGLTCDILLIFKGPNSLYLGYLNTLYNLLTLKYGEPIEQHDYLQSIGKDFNHYIKNISKYSEAERNFDNILFAKWVVSGGNIVIDWSAHSLYLKYIDTNNSDYVKSHQEGFNLANI